MNQFLTHSNLRTRNGVNIEEIDTLTQMINQTNPGSTAIG